MALIDVICPVFNAERWIEAAVRSIITQTFNDWKLILVDDFSSDRSIELVANMVDPGKIRIIKLNVNSGVGAAFKAGVESADSKYIARIDADDINFSNRLQLQMDFLEEFQTINALSAPMEGIDTRNRTTGIFSWSDLSNKEVQALIPLGNVINNPTTFFRREALDGKLSPTAHTVAEDYFTWLKYNSEFNWAILAEPLIYWRKHDTNMSRHGYNFGSDFLKLRKSNIEALGIECSEAISAVINRNKKIETHFELSELTEIKIQLSRISQSNSFQSQLNKLIDLILISSVGASNPKLTIEILSKISSGLYIDFLKKRIHRGSSIL